MKRRGSPWRPAARLRVMGAERLELRAMMAADVVANVAANATSLQAEGEGPLVTDFSLEDVNPNSATYGQMVSPRDFQGSLSGYYFGHAT
ncbi:MAG: hypothetical protein KDA92_10365 [Planctomycetales bacterium]|nr:hypothetical protein [Planctomycetales bacterium]